MKDIRSWRPFGHRASSGLPVRAPGEASADAAAPGFEGSAVGPDDLSEPTMVLDSEGGLIAANAAARALGRRLGVALDDVAGVERLLAAARPVNGGGAPPWVAVADAGGGDAMASALERRADEQVFELTTTPRQGADGRPSGWVVRLLDITALIAALRGEKAAVGHRDTLLKLLSHDMRSPLAVILATLQHPDLGAMPANLKQIIEISARRALFLADSKARLIRARSSNYTFVEIDFCHVVEEAIDGCWSSSKEAGVKIVLEPAETELSILADRGYLIDALGDLFRTMIAGADAGDRLICAFSRGALLGRSAVTLTIKRAVNGAVLENRSESSRGRAAFSKPETEAMDDGDGLDFFKTIIARHCGATVCDIDPLGAPAVSITIPTLDTGVARP